MENEKYSIGNVFETNQGYKLKIIGKTKDISKRIIKFLDEYGYEKEVSVGAIGKGVIENPYFPNVYGVGFKGSGRFNIRLNGRNSKIYDTWKDIIRRCYSNNVKDLEISKSYKNVTVCKEWHNFQTFAEWYENNYPKYIEGVKFNVDKDLLQEGIKNKVYSPTTCVILPSKINTFLKKDSGKTFGIYSRKLKNKTKYYLDIHQFSERKLLYVGAFDSYEEAFNSYLIHRNIEVEKAKQYLRDLKYLDEDIISLIR